MINKYVFTIGWDSQLDKKKSDGASEIMHTLASFLLLPASDM